MAELATRDCSCRTARQRSDPGNEERRRISLSIGRAMVTASLPLGISLTLDQVDATAVAIVVDSLARVLAVIRVHSPRPKRSRLRAHRADVPRRPKTSQLVPLRDGAPARRCETRSCPTKCPELVIFDFTEVR